MSHLSEFQDWSRRWIELAEYTETELADADGRIERVRELWQEPVPGDWQREDDQQLTEDRYRRLHKHGVPTKGSEHEIEHQILEPDPETTRTDCLGGRLIDGVNALPLARSPGQGRLVEADMLLLARDGNGHRQFLVEVKSASNTAWYAVVENLRQLRLFTESRSAKRLFARRRPDLELPENIPVTAVALAPEAFYRAEGKRQYAVEPAYRLVNALSEDARLDLVLATWDLESRVIAARAP